jgi:peptide deformylase
MAILPIIIAPDPILKQRSQEVDNVDNEIKKLMDDMLETMYHNEGAGLAAVQVGVLKRILVIDVEQSETKKSPIFMVNPVITFLSDDKMTVKEGCISFPEQRLEIARSVTTRVAYLDYHGKKQELETDDWYFSRAIQHENDHLNGIVLIDYFSPLKKDILMRRARKLKKLYENQ